MAAPSHALTCPHCQGLWFREEKIVELDGSVVVTKGMPVPAQTRAVSYQYVCVSCQNVLDESFVHGHLEAR
jgi:hypothetical protein|nr:hypothetical protein [Bacilli bacterium]